MMIFPALMGLLHNKYVVKHIFVNYCNTMV